jgi:hypothetical protein
MRHFVPRTWFIPALAVAAILASLFLAKNVDFRVYWLGVTGFFSGTRPAYGPASGLGFPMEYRYPPVTYVLLWPLRFFSLRVGGFFWMLAIWANACWTMWLALRVRKLCFDGQGLLAVLALLAAYLVLAVRYGNVQPFVIAWIFAALILSERRPLVSGLLLALAATFKIWPVLFAPWLFPRVRRTAALWFGAWLATLWAAPLAIFGVQGYSSLLHEWYAAVGRVGTTYSEFYYFPGQSIRGLLLRWLTPVAPPLDYFPRINVVSVPPQTAVHIWMITGALLYASFVVWMLRSSARSLWVWDGAAFLIYSMIEPYAVKSGLISLAPAVLTAGCLFSLRRRAEGRERNAVRWANRLFLIAAAISFFQAVLQYKPWQRYLLSYGLDFWGECLLLAALAIWAAWTHLPSELAIDSSRQTRDSGEHASGVLRFTPERKELPGLAGRTELAIEDVRGANANLFHL